MTRGTKTVPPAAPALAYEYIHVNDTAGKLPAGELTWLAPAAEGFKIIERYPKGDKTKNVYFFRAAAAEVDGVYTPAGKTFRIAPAFFGNETKLRINYKIEVLSTRLTHEYSVDGGLTWTAAPSTTVNGKAKASPLDVAVFINDGTAFMVRVAANGKKPRTVNQEITPLARAAEFPPLVVNNGKIDGTNLKLYEIKNPSNQKWGGLPGMSTDGEHTFNIRLKTTAKFSNNAWTGNACSAVAALTVMRTDGKITAAEIAAGAA